MTAEGWPAGAWAVVWGKETDVPAYLVEPRPAPPWSAIEWGVRMWAAGEVGDD